MKKTVYAFFLLTLSLQAETPVEWVDPMIDTHESRWFYFNSACRPFGMVNLSPDTQTKGSWKSGYLYGDKHIRCFSHVHAWQISGVAVLPVTGEMNGYLGMDGYQSEFSHDDEIVRPGYHKVFLKRYGVTAELTSTARAGFHRYSFPETDDAYVLIDAGAMLGHGPMTTAEVKRISDSEIQGMSVMEHTGRRRKDFPVYFVIRFNQPVKEFGGWEVKDKKKVPVKGVDTISGPDSGAYARFSVKADKPLLMKVGISYTSCDGARRNLDAELNHWNFDQIARESTDEWNSMLSRIMIEGGSKAQRTKFYTDLWRALLGRRTFSDVDGSYCDMTRDKPRICKVPMDHKGCPEFRMYNYDAWWGSHWSLDILWPLLCPERYSEFCNASVEMYKNGGLVPRGPSGGNYTFVMIGDHAAPFITSAYAKGIRDFDYVKALEGLVRNTESDGGRYYGGYATEPTKATWEDYSTKGYVSWDNPLKGGHGKAVTSLTLYNSYHDWCIAQMAKAIGNEDLYKRFIKGAVNYRNVIWKEKSCAWVRMKDGSWKPGFKAVDDTFEQEGFCETSAAVTTFFVPHDPEGLADTLGGKQAAAERLNAQFEAASAYNFYLSGRTHGRAEVDYANQDGTGMAHYFNRIGYPHLSQKWARAVLQGTFSGTDPYHGYNGDEDQGQMGAVSALLAMGLFQFDGGSGLNPQYDITAPVFDKVEIHLSEKYYGGNTFTIIAKNQGEKNVYINSAEFNGRKTSTLLPHAELIKGGTLELELASEPTTKSIYGSAGASPSL